MEEEGTVSSFLGLIETIAAKGLFCSLYTDRGSHYFHTPEAGGKVAPGAVTQVGRALAQLGIEHIAAYSPEARGRSERAFRTLQDRLPKELALAGVTDVEAANRYIGEVYLPAHNARFAAEPADRRSAFVPVARGAMARYPVHPGGARRRAATTRSPGTAGACRSRPIRPAPISCAPRCASTTIPDGEIAVFHGPRRLVAGVPTKRRIPATPYAPAA